MQYRNRDAQPDQAPAAVCQHGGGRRPADARVQDQHHAGEHHRKQSDRAAHVWADPAYNVTTVATNVATSDARSGISYQRRVIGGILTWRKRRSSGRQIAYATAFAMSPPASDQCTVRDS